MVSTVTENMAMVVMAVMVNTKDICCILRSMKNNV